MRNKKVWLVFSIILLVGVIGLIVSGFMSNSNQRKLTANLYFFNAQHTGIVMENRDIEYKYSSELPELVTEALIKGPTDKKLGKIMKSSTKINSISREDGDVTIDFSSNYLSGESAQDVLTTYAVVKTLCGVDNIQRVKVTVDGEEITLPTGNKLSFLSSSDINLQTDTDATQTKEITLYFADANAMYLEPEVRTIKIEDKQSLEFYIVNELIKGPISANLSPVLSIDTSVISVETKDGICFVNMKSSFVDKNTGGSAKESFAVYSIVNSLTELDNVKSVQFLIDGKKVDNFGQFGFSEPFERNYEMFKDKSK